MPSVPLFPASSSSTRIEPNPLPQFLHTPSGLAILEVQGTLHFPSASAEEDSPVNSSTQMQIGKLVFPLFSDATSPDDTAWMKKVYLYVGKHQRMTGEVKKLAKPLAIIRKRPAPEGTSLELEDEELEIAEIIRYKLLFSNRPEPVGIEEGT